MVEYLCWTFATEYLYWNTRKCSNIEIWADTLCYLQYYKKSHDLQYLRYLQLIYDCKSCTIRASDIWMWSYNDYRDGDRTVFPNTFQKYQFFRWQLGDAIEISLIRKLPRKTTYFRVTMFGVMFALMLWVSK